LESVSGLDRMDWGSRRPGGEAAVLRALWEDEDGQTLLEYGLLVALLAVIVIAVLSILGRKTRDIYIRVNDTLISVGI